MPCSLPDCQASLGMIRTVAWDRWLLLQDSLILNQTGAAGAVYLSLVELALSALVLPALALLTLTLPKGGLPARVQSALG